jgi:hypothetical protein
MPIKFLIAVAIVSAATPALAQGIIPWNSSAPWLCSQNYANPNCDPEGYSQFKDVSIGPPEPAAVVASSPAPKPVRHHKKK